MEGSGTTMTDLVNGMPLTVSGTTWDEAHAFTGDLNSQLFDTGVNGSVIQGAWDGNRNIPDVAYLWMHCFKANTSDQFGIVGLSAGTDPDPHKVLNLSGGTGPEIEDVYATTSTPINLGGGDGDIAFHAGSYVPSTGYLVAYGGLNGGAVEEKSNTTASQEVIDDPFRFDYSNLNVFYNTQNFPQSTYGYAVFRFADGVRSDSLEAMTWMSQQWALGHKYIWNPWNV